MRCICSWRPGMSEYDFDRIIERRGTGCEKWDFMEAVFKAKDLVPLWVADMDFASPPEVVDALVRRARHGVYGYTGYNDGYFNAVRGWMQRRHGWDVSREWIVPCPGVVPALNTLVRAFTRPGDRIIVQQPVYHPFMLAAENNGRRVRNNGLCFEGGRYVMDLDDLRKKAGSRRVKMLILCSPHNPVGRLWTRDELVETGTICVENGIIVVSDEIHSDLVLGGRRHVPFASISGELASRSVVCTAPSKTFNLAGLQVANLIIPDADLRREYTVAQDESGFFSPNAFGTVALEAAYT
ncbi:MAG: putative C-S lyase, partial [Spirochaetales bacterium]